MTASNSFYRAAERRIEWFTLTVGAASALVVGARWGWRAATGLALGATLAWINYRWLKSGVSAMAQAAAAQTGAARVRVPKRIYAKFFGRFVFLIAGAYVILSRTGLPGATVLAGLFAPVAAVLLELLYELLRGANQWDAG